ncbi:KTSC domain-containing protein [Devosia lucknowensis]|uniref:KTSC domain-containing protein n=1 Tax=Devosia lucknowensis TaxID=1096929 RepID=A0A1Y6EET5_9HYPH|nr:KTSC domain-containing protein [Devosia lucknowensis]SMQ61087.1 KTSC domain-containing protein [Devosia lucknowensis]
MSAAIRHHHYKPELKELSLWFGPDFRHYKYFGVPQPIYVALVNSESMGRFFNEAIKGQYSCRLVDPSRMRQQRWQDIRSAS